MIRKAKEAYKIWKLLKVNKMTCVFSEEGVQNCANYIAYRVQRALYEIAHHQTLPFSYALPKL